jgi:hypothetical protein
MKHIGLFIVGLLLAAPIMAQITMPAPSPAVKLETKIGLSDVKIEYSRPAMKGRTIFGDLVPYGEVWRTGANASTKITFSDDVLFAGQAVAAGTYAFYTIPGQQEWEVILSANTELWGSMGYTDADDVVRTKVTATRTSPAFESFTLDFAHIDMDVAHLRMMWENTLIEIPVKAEVHSKVLAQIETQVKNNANASAGALYQAANYYFERNMELESALSWVSKALENQQQYWVMHLKAKIEASLGKKAEAIASAEASMKLAEAANNPDYIRLNEKLIASLK